MLFVTIALSLGGGLMGRCYYPIYIDTIPLNTFLINYNCVYECAFIGFKVVD